MNSRKEIGPRTAWEKIGTAWRGVISLSVFITACGCILLAFKAGASAADTHTVSLIREYVAPSEKMLEFMMKKSGVWDEWLKQQADIQKEKDCTEATMRGHLCTEAPKRSE